MVLDGAVSYIFIVTGNQMFIVINIWFSVTIKMFKKMGNFILNIFSWYHLFIYSVDINIFHVWNIYVLVFNNLDTKRNQKFKYHILVHILVAGFIVFVQSPFFNEFEAIQRTLFYTFFQCTEVMVLQLKEEWIDRFKISFRNSSRRFIKEHDRYESDNL